MLFTPTAELSAEEQVVVSPNPAMDAVVVDLGTGNVEHYELHILDVQGRVMRVVQLGMSGSKEVNLKGFPQGMYLFSFRSERNNFVKRVVKM